MSAIASFAVMSALSFTLPGKTAIKIASEKPPLSEQKVSSLQLQMPAGSPWVPLAFDAEMPAHKHGMVLIPTAPQLDGPDLYAVRGVKLHMSGTWLLKLKVKHRDSGEELWLTTPLLLKN